MHAAVGGHGEVARMLLEAGIDIHLTDSVSKFVYIQFQIRICYLVYILSLWILDIFYYNNNVNNNTYNLLHKNNRGVGML